MVDLTGKRVTVMGLGQFGGGAGAVRFLLDHGAIVTLTDLRSAGELESSLATIPVDQLGKLVLGEHREEDFRNTDLIVVNPAVKRDGNRFLDIAVQSGVELTSEIALFWQHCPAKKIVVTGSTGKSTTATLIHQFLLSARIPSRLGGNIGISLLPEVTSLTPEDHVVLELSSFQLADLDRLQPKPDVAVVTNFFPNHLDWHGSLDQYREAKQSAIAYQSEDQIAILNGDDADCALWPTDAKVLWFGHEVWQDRPGVHIGPKGIAVRSESRGWMVHPEDLSPALRTPHGIQNLAAALAAVVVGMKIPIDRIASALTEFQPLPHRFERVAEIDGRIFIDDSKATTPEATIAALNSLSSPVLLIAGGKEKGVSLEPLADVIRDKVKGAAFIGDTASSLEKMVTSSPESPNRTLSSVTIAADLPTAVQWIWDHSAPGDVILLSPACASHAEFLNYEHRGNRFRECIRSLTTPNE